MAHILGLEAAFGQSLAHRAHRAFARGFGGRHMIGIAGGAEAGDLGDDVGAACLRMLKRLKHQSACALASHEAGTARIEGKRRLGGVVRLGDGTQVAKARKRHVAGALFRAAGKRCVGQAEADKAIRLAHAVRPGCARRNDVQAIALQTIADGQVACCHVGDHGGNEQRAYALGALFMQHH